MLIYWMEMEYNLDKCLTGLGSIEAISKLNSMAVRTTDHKGCPVQVVRGLLAYNIEAQRDVSNSTNHDSFWQNKSNGSRNKWLKLGFSGYTVALQRWWSSEPSGLLNKEIFPVRGTLRDLSHGSNVNCISIREVANGGAVSHKFYWYTIRPQESWLLYVQQKL